ncbi:ABC transporter ATP-binding protein [Gordonia sp. VNK21]|uniref:ABC transporter ATP-binding protein n=1 Tax=Gordonia sp. VNK21 TaxID=3382483 RepID=UPI0038D4FA84
MTTNTAPTAALHAENLVKSFRDSGGGRVTAVDGLSLSVQPGEVVAFLGPNGAGKTTTIDMIAGFTRPDSGRVEVYGREPRAAAASGSMALIAQTGGLLPDFTVEESVQIVASLHGCPERTGPVLQRAGIADLAGRRVSRCSGGEQQRLKFAIATLSDPDLIILDEPTAGMDVESRRSFWHAMRADADAGRTVLFATHYLEEADAFADRIVMIAGGRIVADGPTAQIRTLAGARVVSAIVDDDGLTAVCAALPGTRVLERRGGRSYLMADDSDALARTLLTATAAREVEIAAPDLEDAFVALTSV